MAAGAMSSSTLAQIPNVYQVIDPLAIDTSSTSTKQLLDEPVPHIGSITSRSYLLRVKCSSPEDCHAFLFGLATEASGNMSQHGAEYIARSMNEKLYTGRSADELCHTPFSHATILDSLDDNYTLNIEGLCYHCHCENKFSHECWKAAFIAGEKMALLCKDLRMYCH